MTTDDPTKRDEAPQAAKPAARAFAVRLWKEELAGGSEYRGSVRDVRTDGFRGFRDWSDLIAFMVARVEQDESVGDGSDVMTERDPRRGRSATASAAKEQRQHRPSPRKEKEEK